MLLPDAMYWISTSVRIEKDADMNYINELMNRIDALTLRERAAIFIAILAVIFFVWNSILMSDIKFRERDIKAKLQQKQAERTGLNLELHGMISRGHEDPDALDKKKLEVLRSKLAKVRIEVMKSTRNLVSPEKMAGVLESVLTRTQGLDLVEVKGLGSTALLDSGGEKKKDTGKGTDASQDIVNNAYKHGLRIVFNGSYMSTLEYVRKLEMLNSGFLWDSLELEVKDYPRAEAAITVYTLSLDDNWIGV
jgi:MSHA biogenesis protein MshJ